MSVVSRKSLLEVGAHFGHKKDKMDSRMKRYIYGLRGGIHIIDLEKTTKLLNKAYDELKAIAENGGKVLFVGTKKQAHDAVKENAEKCGAFYINSRWLGGTLTNHKTIKKSIDKLFEMEDTDTSSMTSKELSLHNRKLEKLRKNFNGIKYMKKSPSAVFVASADKDSIAIAEANRLGIPVFAIADTDINPENIDHVIPANDDAMRSVALILQTMCNAVLAGTKGEIELSDTQENKSEDRIEKVVKKDEKEKEEEIKVEAKESEDGKGKEA